jgi:molybdopterin molybdotransferase
VDSEGHLRASTTGPQASSRLASLVGANALIVVPPGADTLPAGSRVEAILVGPLVTGHDE